MNIRISVLRVMAALALGVAAAAIASGQGGWKIETGKPFRSAMVKDFYLEGNAIPTEERNAALLATPSGQRLLLALIDTTGYSSEIKQKYIGMMISEGSVNVCGQSVGIGSYGFGLERPEVPSKEEGMFHLYNQAGHEIFSCTAEGDAELKTPKPLQVILAKDGTPWLYLGRFRVELKP
jgi:hypothetical protein